MGLPFYGFKWSLSDPNNRGLFAAANQGHGAINYKDIKNVGRMLFLIQRMLLLTASKGQIGMTLMIPKRIVWIFFLAY